MHQILRGFTIPKQGGGEVVGFKSLDRLTFRRGSGPALTMEGVTEGATEGAMAPANICLLQLQLKLKMLSLLTLALN